VEVYARTVAAAAQYGETAAEFLRAELPHVWHEAYLAMTPGRQVNIGIIPVARSTTTTTIRTRSSPPV
jgi:hypothetical protein